MSFLATVVILALLWAAVTGVLTLPNLLLGAAMASLAVLVIRDRFRRRGGLRRVGKLFLLALLFLRELLLSALRVALLALRPDVRSRLSPVIVAFPLTATRDVEITLLANLITLTPGTLSIDVSSDRKVLYVHALNCPDPELLVRNIAASFERRIIEALR